MFCEKGYSQKFRKIHWKAPVPECLFNKVAGLSHVTLLKKRLWGRCFPVNFAKFLGTSFFIEHLSTTASEYTQSIVSGFLFFIFFHLHFINKLQSPNHPLVFRGQHWKLQSNVRKMFKGNNKDNHVVFVCLFLILNRFHVLF